MDTTVKALETLKTIEKRYTIKLKMVTKDIDMYRGLLAEETYESGRFSLTLKINRAETKLSAYQDMLEEIRIARKEIEGK